MVQPDHVICLKSDQEFSIMKAIRKNRLREKKITEVYVPPLLSFNLEFSDTSSGFMYLIIKIIAKDSCENRKRVHKKKRNT